MKINDTYEATIPPEIGPIIYIHICSIALVLPPKIASKRAGASDLTGFRDAPDI